MNWPKIKAPTFAELVPKIELEAMKQNGESVADPTIPALRLDDALAIFSYFESAAKKANVDWPDWYPFALCALGYKKRGDKFDYKKMHLWTSQECLAKIWSTWLPAIAAKIDESGMLANPRFKPASNSYARWARVAKTAWAKMKKERGVKDPLDRDKKRSSGPWLLLIVLVGLAIAFKDR